MDNGDNIRDGKTLYKFRLIMLGDSTVGKTSLITQYLNNNFRNEYYPTRDLV